MQIFTYSCMEDKSIAFQERDPQIVCLATDVQKTTCGPPGQHPGNSNPHKKQQHNLGKNICTVTPKSNAQIAFVAIPAPPRVCSSRHARPRHQQETTSCQPMKFKQQKNAIYQNNGDIKMRRVFSSEYSCEEKMRTQKLPTRIMAFVPNGCMFPYVRSTCSTKYMYALQLGRLTDLVCSNKTKNNMKNHKNTV